jgi:hypothetical protein
MHWQISFPLDSHSLEGEYPNPRFLQCSNPAEMYKTGQHRGAFQLFFAAFLPLLGQVCEIST